VTAGDIDPENVVTPGIFVDRILDLSASTTQHSETEVAS
jgi:acyl CoA:acetate/3-ketoacid CoA transferase alpha subunit